MLTTLLSQSNNVQPWLEITILEKEYFILSKNIGYKFTHGDVHQSKWAL